MSIDYWRQLDVLDPSKMAHTHITVIGAGGICSPTVLALAKMGVPSITVYDADTVEDHNLPNQVYKLTDIGKHKVDALKSIVREFTECSIEVHNEHYTGQALRPGIVVSGVDSMAARSAIMEKLRFSPNISLYVEARMGAQVSRIYTLNPCSYEDVEWYEGEQLYSDEDAVPEKCTEKAIIYNVFFISALIANQVKKFINGETYAREIIGDLASLTLMSGDG
jgi:molybdopterin/thiamine biosynthesis adenylyltransferase